MKLGAFIIRIFSLLAIFISTSEGAEMTDSTMKDSYKKIYYSSFIGYNLPLRMIGKITELEAKKNDDVSYYIGFYDDKDLIVAVEKYNRGKLTFRHEYEYYKNGKLKIGKITNDNGEVSTLRFDGHGKLTK